MLLLSVDSSAAPASVCLYDGKVLAEYHLNVGLTHSQTLAAMIESVLNITGIKARDIDCYAVSCGPGSFTGVRIGVSAVKGMAYACHKPCIGVSTLESMAYHLLSVDAVVCACMDARRQQVYNALFRVNRGKAERLCEDRAIGVAELIGELSSMNEKIILVGDGAELVYRFAGELDNVFLADEANRFQRASSVAVLAAQTALNGNEISAAALMPRYLRLSQAERERKNQNKGESE